VKGSRLPPTTTSLSPVSPNHSVRLALRATVAGALGVAALIGAVSLLVAAGAFPAPAWPPCWGGFSVALLTTALGNLLLASSLFDKRATSGTRMASALFADMALHLVVGGGTALALFLLRTKFLAAATFALAFAGSVVVMRIIGATVLARALKSAAARPAIQQPTEQR
jgi:hypothetical protein